MYTHNQYMSDKSISGYEKHRKYYSQFVTDYTKTALLRAIPLSKLIKSKDRENLNDIELTLWDNAPLYCNSALLKQCGDYLTLSVKVCILKEAARQIIEEHQLKDAVTRSGE